MGKADRISGFFWLFFSVFGSYHSYKLGLGSLHQPGPGFLFFWTGIIVALLSASLIVRTFRRQTGGSEAASFPGRWRVSKVVFVLIALFVYALLMERLGFVIVTLLLFLFLLGIVEKKRWLFSVPVSFAVTILSYLVFEVALQSQLPKGLLEFLHF